MERLTGDEHFTYEGSPINRLLNDFWAWQASDLLTNSIRGALAEYIVATALEQLPAVKCTYDELRNVIDEIVQEAGK